MREQVSTDAAPAAVGPYSQAMRAGDLVFTAGQLGIDPRSGELVGEAVEEQARQALANVAAILDAAGSGPTLFSLTDDPERADAVAARLGNAGLRVTSTRTRTAPASIEAVEEES